tara:strand:- start:7069 stop:7713 length:645 start_codon:yes stop_codon:yes gene_type:complete
MNKSPIQIDITYPHYTKEILQLIKYCKYGESIVTQNETNYTFRTPILHDKELTYSDKFKNELEKMDVCLIEIASKKVYKYNHLYVHHIAHDQHYKACSGMKKDIVVYDQKKEEIESDILEIKKELCDKQIIIVCHQVTRNYGERYKLSIWLEEICNKYNIPFINPVKEMKKDFLLLDDDIPSLFSNKEKNYNHLSEKGINMMRQIYNRFIIEGT